MYHPALTMLSIHVVSAKPASPSGAGLAYFMIDLRNLLGMYCRLSLHA